MVKGVKVKQHGPVAFEPLGNKPVLDVMSNTQQLLLKIRVPFWFSAGTTLGLVREKDKYIKHDTDIDLEALTQDAEAIKQLMLSSGYDLRRTQMYEGRYMQQAYVYKDIIVDFYFYEFNKEKTELVNYNENGILTIPSRMVDKLEVVHGFPCPSPVEEYLEFRYGENWKTPKKKKGSWANDAGKALRK